MKKDPFATLLLLSARVSEISGSNWHASLEEMELILLNIKIGEQDFFEVGMGSSKTKARNDAAKKIYANSKLINWLIQNKKDELI